MVMTFHWHRLSHVGVTLQELCQSDSELQERIGERRTDEQEMSFMQRRNDDTQEMQTNE